MRIRWPVFLDFVTVWVTYIYRFGCRLTFVLILIALISIWLFSVYVIIVSTLLTEQRLYGKLCIEKHSHKAEPYISTSDISLIMRNLLEAIFMVDFTEQGLFCDCRINKHPRWILILPSEDASIFNVVISATTIVIIIVAFF